MKSKQRASGDEFTTKVLQLQNLAKRDPSLYYDEFLEQFTYFKSLLNLFLMEPQDYNQHLADLVMFLAQVSSHYKSELVGYPDQLMNVLWLHYSVLDADMRMCFCKALILMRNRGLIEAVDLIPLFFRLLRTKDKALRKFLQTHIIADIKNMNSKHKNLKLNTTLQNLMYKIMKDDIVIASKMSLDIMIELYKKNVWRDAKTVNAIATACFSKVNKILVAAHQFFLGGDEEDEEKDSSDSENDDTPTVKDVMCANKVNKKSRRRMKILKRTKQALKNSKKKKNNKEVFDFSAIHLLHDPQGMAEKLLKMVTEMNERYEIKMMVLNLISRLVGVHQLILLNFYELLIRYLKPHQREVTKILTFAAQAAHEYVPPDVMEPVVKTIAYNFVTERNSFEVMTVGINAIREICLRCPLAISQDLLHDIVEYKSYKNKNVQMAARSVIQLFRKINPSMLKRKFRNRPTEATKELEGYHYGALRAKSYIPGSEVLPIEPSNEDGKEEDAGEDNDSDGSWIDVSSSEDELDIDDDDDNNEDGDGEEDDDDEENNEDGDGEEDELNEESDGEKDSENKGDVDELKNNAKGTDNKSNKDKNAKKKDSKTNEKDATNIIDDKEKAMTVSQNRIFSQEEFKKLKAVQISKEVKFAKGKKRKVEEVEVSGGKEIVSLKDIEKLHKKPKADKETRLATILEGREGREKFGKKKNKKNPHSSKTQKVHNKNKAFMMIKHKVRSKQKRSFKDKQIALRNALLKRGRKR